MGGKWRSLLVNRYHTDIVVPEELDEAARLCDRLVIMDNGRILVEGSPADLVKKYVGSEIVEVERTPEIESCLERKGIPFEAIGDTLQIASDSARAVVRILLDTCSPRKVLTPPATLDDVFLKLTGRKPKE